MRGKFQTQKTTCASDLAMPWKCPNCGSKVWRILVNGVEVILDPELLSPSEEILFRADNPDLGTYHIRRFGKSWFAEFRLIRNVLSDHDGKMILARHKHKALATAELPKYFPDRFTYEIPERPEF